MGKKKGKRKGVKPTPPKEEDGFGTLAAQVKAVRRDLRAERRSDAAQREAERAAELERRRHSPEPEPEKPKRRMTRDELMAEAFASLGESFAGAEKYLGTGYDASDVELVERDSEPEAAPRTSGPEDLSPDDLLFYESMAREVKRLDDKRSALVEKEWSGVAWRTAAELVSLTVEELERMEMTPAHRELLRRSRKTMMRVVNVRHLRRADALADVEAFVRGCVASGLRFGRIVHGKGRQSAGDPVLKPAVVAWCEGAGNEWVRAWAPEIDSTGKFGSLVVEFRPR